MMKNFKWILVLSAFWTFSSAVAQNVVKTADPKNPKISTELEVELAGGERPYGLSAKVQPGDFVNFKIFLANIGESMGKSPLIAISLGPRLTYVPNSSTSKKKENNQNQDYSLSDALIRIDHNTITWAFTDMAPQSSDSLYLQFKARVASADQFPIGLLTYRMRAVAAFEGSTPQVKPVLTQTKPVTLFITRSSRPQASVSLRNEVTNITLKSPRWYQKPVVSAAPGDTIGFRLTLVNTGNLALHHVAVKDLLPDGVEFSGNLKLFNKTHLKGLVISGRAIVENGYIFSTLPNGAADYQELTFTAKVVKANSGTSSSRRRLTNRAQVVFPGGVAAEAVASLSINSRRALIVECEVLDPVDNEFKPAIGSVKEGQLLTYRVNVQNNGTISILHPNLQIALPPQLLLLSSSVAIDTQFTPAINEQALFNGGLILTDAAPGMSQVITFQARVAPLNGSKPSLSTTASIKDDEGVIVSDVAVLQATEK